MKGLFINITKSLLVLSFVVSFFVFEKSAFAAVPTDNGLLNCVKLSRGANDNQDTVPITTLAMNDNVETGNSYNEIGRDSTKSFDIVWYEFSEAKRIDSYYLKTQNNLGTLKMKFIDTNGTSYEITNLNRNGVNTAFPTPYENIKKVELINKDHEEEKIAHVYEWDLFGTPVASQSIQAVAGTDGIQLTWENVTNGVTYKVNRTTASGGAYTTIASGVSGTSYLDASVVKNTTYFYQIVAVRNNVDCSCSFEASAQTLQNNRAILVITMTNGLEKEYDLTMAEVNAFIDWYDAKDAGVGKEKYSFNKTWNKGPFLSRTDYVIFDKILFFDVSEYEDTTI
ncbi:hypothetical protein ABEW34_23675 [Paenibacillus algorifonticola]|uniref:hypothetical protein n=1 Tax=Paenibacillus algorifonticola TaxID=684063 RepID=UPI003D2D0671